MLHIVTNINTAFTLYVLLIEITKQMLTHILLDAGFPIYWIEGSHTPQKATYSTTGSATAVK